MHRQIMLLRFDLLIAFSDGTSASAGGYGSMRIL